jgi:UDP-2,3-diacylglucosamine pyrophosphatase LpxH
VTLYPPAFDELWVVSDLHMGGRRDDGENLQAFNQGSRLAKFIAYAADRSPDGNLALVLNGDVFDSLAEDGNPDGIALDGASALRMMDHLYTDGSFAPVWEALATFIRKPRRHLVLVIGNHDIELALPIVEHSIRSQLARGDADAWSRITFSVHGAGFSCQVAGAGVFCTHGNELDEWNWIDYNALGQLANAINAGRRIDPARWKPNAGTHLVVRVMNTIKRRFPFINLLQPEKAAVASVVLMLDPSLAAQLDLSSVVPVWREKREGQRATADLLGSYGKYLTAGDSPPTADEMSQELLGSNVRELWSGPIALSEDELLRGVELEHLGQPSSESLAADQTLGAGGEDASERLLGAGELLRSRLGLLDRTERLRRALQDWLAADRSFDLQDVSDPLYVSLESRIADSIAFVVTGHTHQARAMTYSGGCHYFNTGTWTRTMRLTRQAVDDPALFKQRVWPVLQKGRMSDFDAAMLPGPDNQDVPFVLDRTYAAQIVARNGRAVGNLFRVSARADGISVEPVESGKEYQAR